MLKWSQDSSKSLSSNILTLRLLSRKRRSVKLTAHRLPTELYLHILSFLPPDTKLYPLLFIDSGFHAEVERRLYSNLSLAGDEMKPGKDQDRPVQRRIKLFKTLVRTPHLSHKVHSLTIHPFIFRLRTGYEWQRWDNRGLQYVYWHMLNLALRAVPNLKEFLVGNFCTVDGRVEILPVQQLDVIFDGCTFRLRKLGILEGGSHNIKIPENCDVLGELEELVIPREPYGGFNGRNAFPRLTVMEISAWGLPAWCLPPPNINALYYWASWPPTKDLGSRAMRSHSELRSLRVHLNNWSSPLQRIDVVFPSLRFLHIGVSWRSNTVHYIREIVPHIRALVHLRKIVFSNGEIQWDRDASSGSTPDDLRTRDVAQLFFAAIPQLVIARVDVKEWRRDEIGIDKYTIRNDPEEWKDRKWWN